MHFIIDNSSQRPVYQQIIDQVKRDIALGILSAGQKLPTVRQLASNLVINPNTIAKAYRQLETDGIIITRPGSGAFVAEIESRLSESVRKKIICSQLELTVVDAVHMQVSADSLRQWMDEVISQFNMD